MSLSEEHGRRARSRLVGGAAAALLGAHLLAPTGGFGAVTYCAATTGAALLAWAAVLVARPAPRWAWAAIAVGLTAVALGDLLSYVDAAANGPVPGTSWSDGLWLTTYVGLGAGLVRLGRHRSLPSTEGLLDLLTIAVVGATVVWSFAVEPTIHVDGPSVERLVRGAYPLLDLGLLVVAARLVVTARDHLAPRALVLGMGAWLVADSAYMLTVPWGEATGLLEVGWMAGSLLLGSSAWLAHDHRPATPATEGEGPAASWTRLLVSVTSLLVPALIDLVAHQGSGRDPAHGVLFAATVALVAITYGRVLHVVRSREAVARRLHARERHYEALASSSSDAVLVLDGDGRIRDRAPGLAPLLRRALGDERGLDPVDLIAPVDRAAARAALAEVAATPGAVLTDVVAVEDGEGGLRWVNVRVANRLDDPDVAGLVVALHDVTDQKQAEAELAHQAFHDPLTGLANRTRFRETVDATLAHAAAAPAGGPAVILLDLDGFKAVNDTFGHDLGDVLLTEVGRRLQSVARAGDVVARLGGDEFAVLVAAGDEADVLPTAQAVARGITEALSDPVLLGSRRVTVTASIGVDVARPRADAGTMLRNSDIAMYRAKAEGKARTVVYDPGMRIDAVERFELENDAPHALERGELRLVHQPVVALATGRIVGVEALLRWDHPTQGPIPPDRFIPVLEATGHIVRVGAWVLHEALRTVAVWRTAVPDHAEVQIAVNVSGHQLADPDFVNCVRRGLEAAAVPPAALVLEITETALVGDPTTAAARLAELRELGVILAMDDFGTGYSSLSYLRQFPVHVLKVDRSFTATMPEGDHMPALVAALLDLGRALGLEVVAEGIERPDQRDRLRAAGCQFGQGYLFSRPVGADELAALLVTGLPSGTALSTTW